MFRVVVAFVVAVIAVPLFGPAQEAAAANCLSNATALKPTIKSSVVDQGLDFPTVIRGKQTVVRYALTLGCTLTSTQKIVLGTETMNVAIGATNTTVQAFSPTPTFAPTGTIPVPSDPMFVVPGSVMRPATTAATPVTFTATIPFTSYNGATVVTSGTITNSNLHIVSKTINKQTNGLRVLAVPIGDGLSATPQFSADAMGALQNAMATVGRMYPVADGVGDLNSTSDPQPGVRFAVTGLLDVHNVRDVTGAPVVDSTGKICVSNGVLNALKGTAADTSVNGTLAGTLNAWNAENAGKADIVVGVVDSAIYKGGSCSLGIATVGQPTALVVMAPDVVGAPSPSGAIAAMEIAHTLGDIPATSARMSKTSAYHSALLQADSTKSGTTTTSSNKAYNTLTGKFLPGATPGPAGNFSGMNFTGGNDNNNTAVFEAGDWAYLACKLGSATNTECTTSGVTGAPAGADPLFYISGSTDGTEAGTNVAESYFLNSGVPSPPVDTSSFHVVFTAGATTVGDVPISVQTVETQHGEPNVAPPPLGVFQAAVPFPVAADHVELRAGATVLYAVDRNRVDDVDAPPVVNSIQTGISTGTATQLTDYTSDFPDDSLHPAVSDDGAVLAWTMDGRIFFASATDPTPQAPGHFSEFVDPDKTFTDIHGFGWSADGQHVAVTASFADANDELWRIDVNRNVAPTDSGFVSGAIRLGTTEGRYGSPTWSPDGALVAVPDDFEVSNSTEGAGRIDTYDTSTTDGFGSTLVAESSTGFGPILYASPSWSHAPGSTTLTYMEIDYQCGGCGSSDVFPVAYNVSTHTTVALDTPQPFYFFNPAPSLSLNTDGFVVYGNGNEVLSVPVDQSAAPKVLFGNPERGLSLIHGQLFASLPLDCSDGCGLYQIFSMPFSPTGAFISVSLPGGSEAENARVDVYMRCGTSMIPVAVAIPPIISSPYGADFSFEPLDLSLLCTGGQLVVVASDGMLRSDPNDPGATTPSPAPATPPRPAIYSPTAGTAVPSSADRFLSSQQINLVGGGRDADDGQVADSGLTWYLDGGVAPVLTGSSGTIAAPAPGSHTVRLHAVDSLGRSADTTRTFVVIADTNADGIPDSDTCGSPAANGNPDGDANGDGVRNIDSVTLLGSACTRATSYGVSVQFSPDPFPAGSLLGLLNLPQATVTIRDTFADLSKVDPTTVQLRIGSASTDPDADCPDLVVPASKALLGGLLTKPFSASGGVGTANFSRLPIQSYFANRCKGSGTVPFTISGRSLDGTWTFSGSGSFVVNNQLTL